jgi:SnoaL-like domain
VSRSLRLLVGGLVLFLLAGSIALPSGRGWAAAQTATPVEVVTAFIEALNNDDRDAMMALIDPEGSYISEPGTADEAQDTLAVFIDSVARQGFEVTILSISSTGDDTVALDFTVTGGSIPPLPNPFTAHADITVTNGLITIWSESLSEQTKRDLEVLESGEGAQPGMPTTGRNDINWLFAALGLSLLAITVGAAIRRAYLPRNLS